MNDIPHIRLHPLEGDIFLFYIGLLFSICLILTLALSGFGKIIFILLSVITGYMTFANVYGRLSTKWRRVHYSFLALYGRVSAPMQKIEGVKEDTFDVDIALFTVYKNIVQHASHEDVVALFAKHVSEITFIDDEMYILDKLTLGDEKKVTPELTTEATRIAKSGSQPREASFENFMKVRLATSGIIQMKYGEIEKKKYLREILTGKV